MSARWAGAKASFHRLRRWSKREGAGNVSTTNVSESWRMMHDGNRDAGLRRDRRRHRNPDVCGDDSSRRRAWGLPGRLRLAVQHRATAVLRLVVHGKGALTGNG